MIPQIEEINFPSYATLHQATVSLQEMGERTISTQVRIDGDIAPEYGVWNQAHTVFSPMELVFKGERFILPIREPQASKDNTTRNSISELTFYSWPIYQLKRYFFFSYDPQNTSTAVAEQYNASVKLNLTNFGVLFNRVLDYYFDGDIVMDVSSAATTEAVIMEINYSYLWDVLTKVYEVYGKRWYIERNPSTGVYTIKVGYADRTVDGHVFEYGYEGGLLKFERQVQDPEIYNILLGRGGEKNLPYRYFKQELTENGTTWRGDFDAIPELANIYFDRLRDINFRWYVRGWMHNPRRDTSHDAGYSFPTYSIDSSSPYYWAYQKGLTDDNFNPVEYVKDDESIAKYGELWGAADDFDDVFPTIQGRYADYIGRVDESVAFSEIITDDIQAVAESASIETSLPDVQIYPQSRMAIAEQSADFDTFIVVSNTFTIPTGKTANISFTPFGIDERYPGEIVIDTTNTFGKAVSHNTGIEDIVGTDEKIAVVPAGTWHIEFTIKFSGIDYQQGKTASGVFGFSNIRVQMSAINEDAWKPTFDIWVKNLWGTAKSEDETAQAYAERVWLPILGDRWGKEAKIVFSDGNMSVSEDYEFVITSIPVYDTSRQITTTDASGNTITVPSHWRITLRKSDAELEALGVYIPSSQPQQKPYAGDHFYFIGVDLPQQYVLWAEEQLNGTAFTPHINKKAILDGQADINPSWVVTLDKVRAHTIEAEDLGTALVDRLVTGAKLSTRDSRFTGGETIQLYITSLTYTWNEPTEGEPNIVPNIEVVLSDKIASTTSAFSKLQGEVSYIQRSYATNEDIEAVVRRIADEFFLKKNGEPDASQSPTSFASKVASADFSQGQMTGQGWGIYRSNAPEIDASEAVAEVRRSTASTPAPRQDAILELDVLRVRKSLEVNELVANQTVHVGGRRIQSAASITCSQVVEDANEIICYFDQKQDSVRNLFVEDDIALMQTFDAENSLVRYCKRRVIGIGENYITLSTTDVDGNGVPQKGDVLVQYGNYTNTARQYVIIQDVIGGGYEQMISGLDSVSATGTEYYFAGRQMGANPRWFVGNRASGQYAEFANGRMTIAGPATIGQGGNATTIEGNLVQTGTISLGSTSNNVFSIWAGMSGVYDGNVRGGGVAAWYGGPKVDHEVNTSAAQYAKSLFRFDGSGYLAGGNIAWNADGYGHIPGISWDSNRVAISSDIQFQTGDATYARLVDVVRNFNMMFTLENTGTAANPLYRIKANYGLYTNSFLSSGGLNTESGGGGGASTLSDLNDVRINNLTSGQVLAYNGTYWVNAAASSGGAGTLNTNNATAQSVNSSESLSGTVKLHKVSKTGSYNDLLNKPDLSGYVTLATTQTIAGAKTFTSTILANGGVLMPSNAALFYNYNNVARNVMCINEDVQTLLYGYDTRSLLHTNLYGKTVNLYTNNNTQAISAYDTNVTIYRHLLPKSDGTSNLGGTSNRWSHIYWANNRSLFDEQGAVLTTWGSNGILINGDETAANTQRQVIINGYNTYFTYGNRSNAICLIDGNGLKPAVNGNVSNGTGANLGGPDNHWRLAYIRRWCPNGASGPYIEYDTTLQSFKVAGNMYVTGFLTGGATGVNDVQSTISYDLVPVGSHNLGSTSSRFNYLYANNVNTTNITATAITAGSINITATTRNAIAAAMKARVYNITSLRNNNGLIDEEDYPEFYDEFFDAESAILSNAVTVLTDESGHNLYRIVGVAYTNSTNYTIYLGWRYRIQRTGNNLYMYNTWS